MLNHHFYSWEALPSAACGTNRGHRCLPLPPPAGSLPTFISRIGFNIPTTRQMFHRVLLLPRSRAFTFSDTRKIKEKKISFVFFNPMDIENPGPHMYVLEVHDVSPNSIRLCTYHVFLSFFISFSGGLPFHPFSSCIC